VKILKEKSREYQGRAYYKYKVNLPEVVLKTAGLNAGDELEVSAEKDKITLKRAKIEEKGV
jgi:bifunctional DNA-binding transcriptional regulator/antitoxin component of YhaV-PrlF toxin-antitoxin module